MTTAPYGRMLTAMATAFCEDGSHGEELVIESLAELPHLNDNVERLNESLKAGKRFLTAEYLP